MADMRVRRLMHRLVSNFGIVQLQVPKVLSDMLGIHCYSRCKRVWISTYNFEKEDSARQAQASSSPFKKLHCPLLVDLLHPLKDLCCFLPYSLRDLLMIKSRKRSLFGLFPLPSHEITSTSDLAIGTSKSSTSGW